jgi:hypothetical protein
MEMRGAGVATAIARVARTLPATGAREDQALGGGASGLTAWFRRTLAGHASGVSLRAGASRDSGTSATMVVIATQWSPNWHVPVVAS